MSGDVVVLTTALGVLFVAMVGACAVAYGFWHGSMLLAGPRDRVALGVLVVVFIFACAVAYGLWRSSM